ncbi:porin [Roseibium sp. RKSG952]|uniref:porin n=1 Tax=Roseibium sp. RKSG952 TaxID=2529384 RepID=UPI0012BBC7FE|nr:porin [Roseibium sp. RKSG952]MTI00611.1 porin [Roseibium sp. RKSG952]
MRAHILALATIGSAALSAPAFAADLPVAPEPADYVRICDVYGNRFYYIPGTDTCLRVGGRVRADFRFKNFGDAPNDWSERDDDGVEFRARGYLYLDSRTQTEFGILRSYTSMYMTDTSGSESFTLEYGYIQWGGLTFGYTDSYFDFWTGFALEMQLETYTDLTSTLFAYTAAFGDGFSATVSVEDATFRETNLIAPGTVDDGYAGQNWPDIVANLRVDRDWGAAQVMGALHNVRFQNPSASGQVGWAVGGGVELELDRLLTGTNLAIQGVYTDGASGYGTTGWDDQITDAVYTGSSTNTTKTWNIYGGVRQGITETVEFNLDAGYHNVDGDTRAYDFTQWDVTPNVLWEPASGFLIGGEVQYRDLDFSQASGQVDRNEIFATIRFQRTF